MMNNLSTTLSSAKTRLSNGLSTTKDKLTTSTVSTKDKLTSSLASTKDKLTTSGNDWSEVESPVTKALHGAVQTANGPYVVGTDGRVLRRTEGAWETRINSGPAVKNNTLTTVDVTSDGKRIWFAGSSESLGAYDLETSTKCDYSAPKEKTSTWEAIAVTGEAGNERLRIANGSGEVLPVTTDENGCPQWGEVTKPGSGSTIAALDYGGDTCYAIDTSGNVFEEADDWSDIGIENAQVNLYDLCATEKSLLVAGGDGKIYRYDRACANWTPVSAGEGAPPQYRSNRRRDGHRRSKWSHLPASFPGGLDTGFLTS